ncbi:hypothetical protein [Pelagibius sp.]|uniref:hypothetical protein n=1 Tax=Pelagibius sp. TaxID=1931238 RepID=UPI002636FF75|nr:hypothetical protein [Pelagibius sp.]
MLQIHGNHIFTNDFLGALHRSVVANTRLRSLAEETDSLYDPSDCFGRYDTKLCGSN